LHYLTGLWGCLCLIALFEVFLYAPVHPKLSPTHEVTIVTLTKNPLSRLSSMDRPSELQKPMAFLQRGATPQLNPMPKPEAEQITQPQSPPSSSTRPRPHKNAMLFLGGVTFMALSTLVTRRSLARKYRATLPPFYTASTRHKPAVDGATEALEALSIATVNVVSVAMMAGGAALWYFDINSLADMRRKIRGGLGVAGDGQSEQEAEEEMEEWLATVLARKEDKERRRKGDGGDEKK
jgi:hypothetical protein